MPNKKQNKILWYAPTPDRTRAANLITRNTRLWREYIKLSHEGVDFEEKSVVDV